MPFFKSLDAVDYRSVVLVAALGCHFSVAPAEAQIATTVEIRDGVELETFIYLPDGDGPFPTLVTRTIYGLPISPIGGEVFSTTPGLEPLEGDDDLDEAAALAQGWPLINERGYALVVQNTRGRFGSGGVDRSWLDDRSDGYDLVQWVNQQDWSNGRIGLFGDSAVGMTAALAAAAQPPALDALYLQAAPGDPFGIDMAPAGGGIRIETMLFQGSSIAFDVSESHVSERGISPADMDGIGEAVGGLLGALGEGMTDPQVSPAWMAAPLAQSAELSRLMPFWNLFTDPGLLETYRTELNVRGSINVPTSMVTLWQDTFAASSLALHADLVDRGIPTELLVLNGTHYEIDDPSIFPEARMLSWFDHWLKDAPAPNRDAVKVAVQASDAVLTQDALAEASAHTSVYRLAADGALTTAPVKTADASIVSDPMQPVPTLGGRNLVAAAGSTDHSMLIARSDTTFFTSAPVEAQSLISGSVSALIKARSDAPSFDVSARLLDVAPDGSSKLILSDLARATSDADGFARIAIDLGHIVHKINAGHSVGLLLAGSDFPAWDRNPQTGASIFETNEVQATTLTFVLGGTMPSTLSLPIIPMAELATAN